jgi:hypothetical protein
MDDKQKYIGYSIDLCMKAVAAIQTCGIRGKFEGATGLHYFR